MVKDATFSRYVQIITLLKGDGKRRPMDPKAVAALLGIRWGTLRQIIRRCKGDRRAKKRFGEEDRRRF